MGLDMTVTATTSSGQKIVIRRWRKNIILMRWFKERAKARGKFSDPEEHGFGTDILQADVDELSRFVKDSGDYDTDFANWEFMESLRLDFGDVNIWGKALRDGFKLHFGAY